MTKPNYQMPCTILLISLMNNLILRTDHPTAEAVYTSVRKDYPNISLGTVYRNLSLLTDLGEVLKITTDGADRFDARITPHHHFACRQCGRVMDIMIPVEDPVQSVNARWDGGEIEECRMLFYGICSECKKMKN